jgi:CBS domain-containing protein
MPNSQNAPHHTTKVGELMKEHPSFVSPDDSLKEAAQKMEAVNCGILPVGSADKVEGVITDRDIVLRAVAKGKDMNREKVRNYMTTGVWYCSENDSLAKAAKLMHTHHVNRLLVKDSGGGLCGIVSFGRLIRKDNDMEEVAHVVEYAVGKHAA